MNLELKSIGICILFLFFIGVLSYGQEIEEDLTQLNFNDEGRPIENLILLNISLFDYDNLHYTTGEKAGMDARKIVINGDTLKVSRIRTRGQSTLMFRRKSLNCKLKSKATFRHGKKSKTLKHFYLLNLSMDKYYCRNRLAFEMMEDLNLFHLFYGFGELRINGKSEGIYMIVERPEDWALKEQNSPLVLRRGYKHRIEKYKAAGKTDRQEARAYINNYKQIYRVLNEYEGEELYLALQEYIDLDFYMDWLAFNFLVHNGDYADEVFFYVDREIKKFRIIPWDYDDIFVNTPHEGTEQRDKVIGDKLLFSSEDLLDIKIATDPYLYDVYLSRFREILQALSLEQIKQIIEDTYAELVPYYSDQEIISNARFDHFADASLETLEFYLSRIYIILYGTRDGYMKVVDGS